MTPAEFIEFLTEPLGEQNQNSHNAKQNPAIDALPFLEKLVSAFPSCQTAQVLYAIHLHRQNNVLYPIQLKKAAIYATDRKLLYRYIMQPLPACGNTKEYPMQTVIEEPGIHESHSIKEEESSEAKPVQQIETKKITGLEEEILKEAINAAMIKEVMEEMDAEVAKRQQEEEKEKQSGNTDNYRETKEQERIVTGDKNNMVTGKEEDNFEMSGRKGQLSFSDWLKAISPPPQPQKKKEKNKVMKVKETTGSETTGDLLNKFIRNNPQIKPIRDFYSPANFAKISSMDDESWVSETLAKIYIRQGDFSKAVRIYTLLAGQEPSGKEYYEEQIKKIRNIDT